MDTNEINDICQEHIKYGNYILIAPTKCNNLSNFLSLYIAGFNIDECKLYNTQGLMADIRTCGYSFNFLENEFKNLITNLNNEVEETVQKLFTLITQAQVDYEILMEKEENLRIDSLIQFCTTNKFL